MKKEERKVIYYAKDDVKKYASLVINVDDRGEGWLTPDQIDYLELKHAMAGYEGNSGVEIIGSFSNTTPQIEQSGISDLKDAGFNGEYSLTSPLVV